MKARMIIDTETTESIIKSCEVCFVGMVDHDNMPYTLPFNFGYDSGYLYIHSGPHGHKLDVLANNPNICVAMSTGHQMYHQSENVACSYGMKYKSVLLKGKLEFLEDIDDKVQALSIIMRQYTQREDYRYSVPSLKNVTVMRLKPDSIECKFFGY